MQVAHADAQALSLRKGCMRDNCARGLRRIKRFDPSGAYRFAASNVHDRPLTSEVTNTMWEFPPPTEMIRSDAN
jgi:hypothetical protein